MILIGLFGTCSGSKWRESFMTKYRELGISYFNPQVENWDPSCAEEEARHLAENQIILFPITNETYAFGSLSETGFSILQAIRLDNRRGFVVMIAMDLAPELNDPLARQESLRSRALVKQHLTKLRLPNLYVVDSLEEMMEVSLQLHKAVELTEPLRRFNPQNR